MKKDMSALLARSAKLVKAREMDGAAEVGEALCALHARVGDPPDRAAFAENLVTLGEWLAEDGKSEARTRCLTVGSDTYRRLTAEDPGRFGKPLADALVCLYHADSGGDRGRAAIEEAVAVRRQLVATDGSKAHREALLWAMGLYTEVLEAANDLERCFEVEVEAVAIARHDGIEPATLAGWLDDCGSSLVAMEKDWARAATYLTETVALHRTLAAADPVYERELARSLWLLGRAKSEAEGEEAGVEIARESVAVWQRIAANPGHDAAPLGDALNDLAMSYSRLGRHAEALAATTAGVEAHRRSEGDRDSLALALWTFAEVRATAKRELAHARKAMKESVLMYKRLAASGEDCAAQLAEARAFRKRIDPDAGSKSKKTPKPKSKSKSTRRAGA